MIPPASCYLLSIFPILKDPGKTYTYASFNTLWMGPLTLIVHKVKHMNKSLQDWRLCLCLRNLAFLLGRKMALWLNHNPRIWEREFFSCLYCRHPGGLSANQLTPSINFPISNVGLIIFPSQGVCEALICLSSFFWFTDGKWNRSANY